MYAKWLSKPMVRKRWMKHWVFWSGGHPREAGSTKIYTYLSDNLPMIFPAGRCELAENEMR